MITPHIAKLRALLLALLPAAAFLLPLSIHAAQGLDGATGNIFKVNPDQHTFELLKETEYDPKTSIGRSRFSVYWDDQTRITKVTELQDFSTIPGPIVADVNGFDAKNADALIAGQPFTAPFIVLLPKQTEAAGWSEDHRRIVARFTPDPGPASKSGTIEVEGKLVKVSLRRQNAHIFVHEPLTAADVVHGFWKGTLHGKETDGQFMIQSMEVQALVDPRTVDDPKLPRVLVIGDSISMNYHDAAKRALAGAANYYRNEGNSFSTIFGVANMELWLGDYKEKGLHWDVIQFNHGLHDLKQTYDAAKGTFGDYAVPLADYQKNLEKEIDILKRTGAKLIWCTTTPVPNDNKSQYARRKGAEADFNRAALEVMRRHPEILVTDLAKLVNDSPLFDEWRKGVDVHFYRPEEQKALGEAVAATIRRALAPDRNR